MVITVVIPTGVLELTSLSSCCFPAEDPLADPNNNRASPASKNSTVVFVGVVKVWGSRSVVSGVVEGGGGSEG